MLFQGFLDEVSRTFLDFVIDLADVDPEDPHRGEEDAAHQEDGAKDIGQSVIGEHLDALENGEGDHRDDGEDYAAGEEAEDEKYKEGDDLEDSGDSGDSDEQEEL